MWASGSTLDVTNATKVGFPAGGSPGSPSGALQYNNSLSDSLALGMRTPHYSFKPPLCSYVSTTLPARSCTFMKLLASQIARELSKADHCAVYEPDLSRMWPDCGASREAEIASFAKRHGWRLRHYKAGFCAIFVAVC